MLIDRQEILYALRSARRTPLLTVIVVLALSIGIGLNAGVFTILDFMFLEPPTRRDPSSFVQIYPRYEGWFTGATQFSSLNADDYDAIRAQLHSLSDFAAWQDIQTTVDGVPRKIFSLLVTCNWFHVFGIEHPLMGRFFFRDECISGTSVEIAVLSEHFWKNFYSSDPHIIGKVIHINRQPLTVVGVVPDSSANMMPGDVWIPYTLQPVFNHGKSAFHEPTQTWLSVAGRLQRGYSRAEAAAELETILRRRDRFYIEQKIFTLDRKTSVVLTNGSFIENPSMQSIVVGLMALIMGPLSLVLLLACTNVTMLFLSRSIVRRGEIAVRLALGAGRAGLLRMLALESFLTASVAGALSICLAARVPALLLGSIDPVEGGQFASGMRPDWRVFGYLAFLVLIATVASAVAPMRESFRFDLVTALKGREGAATMRSRTTSVLIVMQLAMSFVLLAAAVLFARLPFIITGIDPGFETRQTMTVPLEINIPPYTEVSALAFYRTLETRILGIPGIQSLTYASIAPFGLPPQDEVRLDNQTEGQGRAAAIDKVSVDFFPTFGIPLLHGRFFLPSDVSASGSAPIAIVSQAFAKAFCGVKDPTGKAVVTPDGRHLTVIGVARDTRSEHYGMLDGPRLYMLRDSDSLQGQLFVRFKGSARLVSASIEQVVKTLDSSQLDTPSTIWDSVESEASAMRSLARIILFMAGIAVLLAVTGVYAVLNFAINRRIREFAIQIMLGAARGSIFRSVMIKGLQQIAVGLLGGMVLAVPLAWTFASLIKRSAVPIHTFDISVYGISALVLLVVSLCAMGLPAFRATEVDPIEALRNE
jgi:predicted permease